ncbi:unannotated protein [freshwater metagenome]|uniref:Unannotated protein n=1 Tax=freshwater metagenome TaxID=449393 RepID=A0A6J5YJ36_9ZZZZ
MSEVIVFPSVAPERSGCGQVTKRALLEAAIATMQARGLIKADLDLDPDTEWSEYTYSALVAIPTP